MMSKLAASTQTTTQSQENQEDLVYGNVYNHGVVTRMLPYLKPHKLKLLIAILAMLVFSGSQVSFPWLIKIAIDNYIMMKDFAGLTGIAALFIVLAAFNLGGLYLMQVMLIKVGQAILYRLRSEMFQHIEALSLRFFDKAHVGQLMSRVQGDVYQLQEFISVVVMCLGDLLVLIWIISALLLMNVKLGLISMAVLPILFLVVLVWQPRARKSFVRVRAAISVVNGSLNDNIAGVRVVQSMNRQEYNLEEFKINNRNNMSASMTSSKLSAGLMPPVDILTAMAIGLALIFGSSMVADGSLEVGAMIAFVLYIQRFFDPIRSITMQYSSLQRAMASGSRIFQTLESVPDLADKVDAVDLPVLKGEIEYKDVNFGYSANNDVLKDVNLHINPGETVAIVGPTGAGKTTMVALLSRLYDVEVDRGTVMVDGYDIRDETRHSLVNQMSMVLQEPFLFSGTVFDNIRYAHLEVDRTKIIDAAKAVGAHDFIELLDDGYDTFLNERGINLSMGQRQLISFARAIVADPRILILDEATASIDTYSELLIQRALKTILKDRTAIVIAHRLSTIRGADKIVVLSEGRIIEVGTHTELIKKKGFYNDLYEMNFSVLNRTSLKS